MAKLDEFKGFVKKNPELIKYVKKGDMTWQKFYEIYDLYGEDSNAWKDYLTVAATATGVVGLGEIANWFKGVNLGHIQSGVNNLQRVLGVIQDLSSKDTKTTTPEYKPRPIYKHFDD